MKTSRKSDELTFDVTIEGLTAQDMIDILILQGKEQSAAELIGYLRLLM